MIRTTLLLRLGSGANAQYSETVLSDPIAPGASATVTVSGTVRPSNSNTQGLYDLRAGGITLQGGTLDGRGICPLWITDSSTNSCVIRNLTGRNGSAVGSFETNLLGGNMQTQAGGGHVVQGCNFEYMKIRYGGVGHIFRANRFYRSPEGALQQGIRPNDLTKWSENSCFGGQVLDCQFVECGTTWSGTTDDGILYWGRRWGTGFYARRLSFTSCKGNAIYMDDCAGLVDIDTVTGTNQTGRLLHINGGRHIAIANIVDNNSSLASKWTDIASMHNGLGGDYGSNYNNGSWHGQLPAHNNGGNWSHDGGISGSETSTTMYDALNAEHTKILLAGSANWLTALNALYAAWGTDYATHYALDTTWTTTGTLTNYTRTGSTPAMTYNAGVSTPTSGITVSAVS